MKTKKSTLNLISKSFALMLVLLLTSIFSLKVNACDATAAVSDIDYQGMGTFSGNYTHSNTDHVWFVFNANAGDVITVSVNTAFTSVLWTYLSNTGCIQVGNSNGNCMTLTQSNGTYGTGSYTITVSTTGQFAIQLDSYLCGSGSYSVTLSGSTATTALCTPSGGPTFTTCPSNISSGSSTVTYSAAASSGSISYTFSGATTGSGSGTGSGSTFNAGTTNVVITATTCIGTATCSLTVTYTPYILYGVSGAAGAASTLYTINPATGAIASTIGSTGQNHVTGLAIHPTSGIMYAHINSGSGSSNGKLATINTSTGVATIIGTTNIECPTMAFSPSGVLYAWMEFNNFGAGTDKLCTVNLSTGAVTVIGSNQSTAKTGMCFDPVSGKLYLKNHTSVNEVNTTNGSFSNSAGYSGTLHNLLAIDPSGLAYTGTRSGSSSFTLIRINLTTGATTSIGSNAIGTMSSLTIGVPCTAATISSISVTPNSSVYTGGVNTNLYLGYGPTAVNLSTNTESVVSWSPSTYLSCATCASTVFTPTVEGNYTLTASNCAGSKTVTFCVKDIRVKGTTGSGAKVMICHKEPVTNVTKSEAVLASRASSHFNAPQQHAGCKLGASCSSSSLCATSKKEDFDYENVVVDENGLEVSCTPNPFRQSFKLNYISNSDLQAIITIYGMTGNLIESRTLASLADEVELGQNLTNGIYTVSFTQGDKNRVFRMIKVD